MTSEDKKKIDEIRDNFSDSPPVTKTVQEEEELKIKIMNELSFVGEKIKFIADSVVAEAKNILAEFDEKISRN